MKRIIFLFILGVFWSVITSSVWAENPTGMSYYKNGDRVSIILKGAKLTNFEEAIENLYSLKYMDRPGRTAQINFPLSSADIEAQTLQINDEHVQSAELTKSYETLSYSLVIKTNRRYSYHIITRYDASGNVMDTAITLILPVKNKQLVIIDAGHGGYESGAVSRNIMEKNLNLSIAKLVEEKLKQKNIPTYMMRSEDVYVDLYERAYIANQLNASLFVSIHNNSNNTKSRGTETLYFPNGSETKGITGINTAQNIQSAITKKLKTNDRGIIPRPGLVVLRKTNMPSIISEIGYIDNKIELARLKKRSYQQKAASAIVAGIIKTLEDSERNV